MIAAHLSESELFQNPLRHHELRQRCCRESPFIFVCLAIAGGYQLIYRKPVTPGCISRMNKLKTFWQVEPWR